jgi:tetratricopeptide (TPR) repeat protein
VYVSAETLVGAGSRRGVDAPDCGTNPPEMAANNEDAMLTHNIARAWLLVGWVAAAQTDAPAPAAGASAEARMKEAWHLLQEAENTETNLRAAIKAYDEAIQLGLSNEQKAVSYASKAKALIRLGDLQKTDDAKVALFEEGKKAAEAAIAADPKSSQAHYYRAATMGRVGQTRGVLKSLFMVDDLRKTFTTASKLDPKSVEPLLGLAKLDESVPGLLGGSMERAEKTYQQAMTLDPHHTRARLEYAEFLNKTDRRKEALEWVQKVLAETAPSHSDYYRKFDRPKAESLLKKWQP